MDADADWHSFHTCICLDWIINWAKCTTAPGSQGPQGPHSFVIILIANLFWECAPPITVYSNNYDHWVDEAHFSSSSCPLLGYLVRIVFICRRGSANMYSSNKLHFGLHVNRSHWPLQAWADDEIYMNPRSYWQCLSPSLLRMLLIQIQLFLNTIVEQTKSKCNPITQDHPLSTMLNLQHKKSNHFLNEMWRHC